MRSSTSCLRSMSVIGYPPCCSDRKSASRNCVFAPLRNSVRRAALEKMAIAVLCHPLRALEVALPGAPRPVGLLRWIDVQHYARHLGPIRTLGVGVEEPEIGDQVLLVITGENVSLGDLVGDERIKQRLAHDHSLPS